LLKERLNRYGLSMVPHRDSTKSRKILEATSWILAVQDGKRRENVCFLSLDKTLTGELKVHDMRSDKQNNKCPCSVQTSIVFEVRISPDLPKQWDLSEIAAQVDCKHEGPFKA
ncbi:hypothetical protein OS493_040220, partial [Desmophyllum pertusum]